MALRIDIDDLRDCLGSWSQAPAAAGVRARALATAMALDHLRSDHDVIVAQAYGQPDHLDELAALASEVGATYFEIVLTADAASTLERFTRRGGPRLEEALAAPQGLDGIAAFAEQIERLARTRPRSRFVALVPDDVAATYDRLLEALEEPT
jgi:hypothetical protein